MTIFNSYVSYFQRLEQIPLFRGTHIFINQALLINWKLWFSIAILVYQRVNLHFPLVFPHFLYGFPMVFPFSYGFPMFFSHFTMVFPWFSHGSPMVFPCSPSPLGSALSQRPTAPWAARTGWTAGRPAAGCSLPRRQNLRGAGEHQRFNI